MKSIQIYQNQVKSMKSIENRPWDLRSCSLTNLAKTSVTMGVLAQQTCGKWPPFFSFLHYTTTVIDAKATDPRTKLTKVLVSATKMNHKTYSWPVYIRCQRYMDAEICHDTKCVRTRAPSWHKIVFDHCYCSDNLRCCRHCCNTNTKQYARSMWEDWVDQLF